MASTAESEFWVSKGHKIRIPTMNSVEMVKYGDFSEKGFKMIQKPMKVSVMQIWLHKD